MIINNLKDFNVYFLVCFPLVLSMIQFYPIIFFSSIFPFFSLMTALHHF